MAAEVAFQWEGYKTYFFWLNSIGYAELPAVSVPITWQYSSGFGIADPKPSALKLTVTWSVDFANSGVIYDGVILVRGPQGLPY